MALRGYDREAVDAFVAEVADLIDALEARQARETVVQRALEEVGEETSAILKQAHESADDITARSRSQAEDRLEVARREAEEIVREARQEATQLRRQTEHLHEERANLIEELRRFAADTLAVADSAADRLDVPAASDGLDAPGEPEPAPAPPPARPGAVELATGELVHPEPPFDGAPEIDRDELDAHGLDPDEGWPGNDPAEETDELPLPGAGQADLDDDPPRPA